MRIQNVRIAPPTTQQQARNSNKAALIFFHWFGIFCFFVFFLVFFCIFISNRLDTMHRCKHRASILLEYCYKRSYMGNTRRIQAIFRASSGTESNVSKKMDPLLYGWQYTILFQRNNTRNIVGETGRFHAIKQQSTIEWLQHEWIRPCKHQWKCEWRVQTIKSSKKGRWGQKPNWLQAKLKWCFKKSFQSEASCVY